MEINTNGYIKCRRRLLQQGYKDVWYGSESVDIGFTIMESSRGEGAVCHHSFDGREPGCRPLRRAD
jgi:hypothetical protein